MRELTPFWKKIVAILATFWIVFLVYTSITLPLLPLFQGPICLCFALTITFLLYPLDKKRMAEDYKSWSAKLFFGTKSGPAILDLIIIVLCLIPVMAIMAQWRGIAYNEFSSKTLSPANLAMGSVLIVLLIEVSRRTVGWVITTVVLTFIGYALLGQYIPGKLGHTGFSVREMVYQIYLMQEGVTGMLLDVGSRVLPLFIVFGSVLFYTGAGDTLMSIAQIACGRIRGGAGQVAMASSALFGTVSGSSVANVTATGVMTIPTMKKMGFYPELAGAIESSASTGGQIMPPMMGAGAFLMAEFLGQPYTEVMAAAFIPALIYFTGIAAGIFSEAGSRGLGRISRELIPKFREVFSLRSSLCLFIPLGILVYLLVIFAPAQVAAVWALLAVTGLYLLLGGDLSWSSIKYRIKHLSRGYLSGLASLAMLIAMITCIQMVIVCISMTGIGVKLSSMIISLGDTNIVTALLLTAAVGTILGMGMPTTAAYVIAVAVAAPPLIQLGFDPLATHLFVYYYAILSGLTPPVCVTVFTAATISGGSWMKMALISMRLALGGFLLPFFFINNKALLLSGEPMTIVTTALTGLIGIFFLVTGVMGTFLKPNSILERLLYIAGGLMAFIPGVWLDLLGLGLIALGIVLERLAPEFPVIGRHRKVKMVSPAACTVPGGIGSADGETES